MMILKEIKHLLHKEVMLEWRQKSSINGILLYVASTIFVVYLSFRTVTHPATWNALFWIIMLFAATNAAGKSFSRESRSTGLYIYSIVSPQAVILSKIIYNIILMIVISMISYFFYSLFIGNIVQDVPMFLLSLLLGSMGFASVLTLVAAIASKSGNNLTLMAILSFPVLLPLLITLIKISKNAIDGIDPSISYQYMFILMLINMIIVILSFILFPYLWRD
ncbi:MAG: heme exporter protein CcmB [Bacteroidetes bacterium]|nr:heme exporter protein CcmB [Bacteroidota bacterium]